MNDTPTPPETTPMVRSPLLRAVLIAIGTLCVGLGILGAFLPVLPTTPFLLVAAACYARSSRRFYVWLLNAPAFGPLIRSYREHGVIPVRAKVMAVTMIAVTIGLSAAFVIPLWPVKILVVAIGTAVSVWLLSHPSTPSTPES
ncbi:MAG: YbaN family protein [Myxococcota bacterium]